VPVSGTKALYGHPLGASGAIEAVLCSLVIRSGWAPGTANLDVADPDVLAEIPGLLREPCRQRFRRVLSTSFGFGGLNSALVLGAPED
jgi:3-oxoacyl-[acyl-carrier-protein] synthase II